MWKYIGITVIILDSEIIWSSFCMWIVPDDLREGMDSTYLLSYWILLWFQAHNYFILKYCVWHPFEFFMSVSIITHILLVQETHWYCSFTLFYSVLFSLLFLFAFVVNCLLTSTKMSQLSCSHWCLGCWYSFCELV